MLPAWMSRRHSTFAKPKHHVAKIMDSQDTLGWIVAALLREVANLGGKATLESL